MPLFMSSGLDDPAVSRERNDGMLVVSGTGRHGLLMAG